MGPQSVLFFAPETSDALSRMVALDGHLLLVVLVFFGRSYQCVGGAGAYQSLKESRCMWSQQDSGHDRMMADTNWIRYHVVAVTYVPIIHIHLSWSMKSTSHSTSFALLPSSSRTAVPQFSCWSSVNRTANENSPRVPAAAARQQRSAATNPPGSADVRRAHVRRRRRIGRSKSRSTRKAAEPFLVPWTHQERRHKKGVTVRAPLSAFRFWRACPLAPSPQGQADKDQLSSPDFSLKV